MDRIRSHLNISGRVQGVFFRHHTLKKAQELGIVGWVRNRADGTVEAVLEGNPGQVQEMVEWFRIGPPHARVSDVREKKEGASGEFSSFKIRYD